MKSLNGESTTGVMSEKSGTMSSTRKLKFEPILGVVAVEHELVGFLLEARAACKYFARDAQRRGTRPEWRGYQTWRIAPARRDATALRSASRSCATIG